MFRHHSGQAIQLRLFDVEDEAPNLDWTLHDIFHRWYVPTLRADRRRRPVSQKTIDRRSKPIEYWTDLMKSAEFPIGPPIRLINEDLLEVFRERLKTATYTRGLLGFPRLLGENTQLRAMQEVQIVLAACGNSGRGPRAGLMIDPPRIWTEALECVPPEVWSLEEARAIAAAITDSQPPRRRSPSARMTDDQMRDLARATLGLWYYTGHRSSTYEILRWQEFVEAREGVWYLRIPRSVKTHKRDHVRMHPQLRELLERCRGLDAERVLPWPISYGAIGDWHARWQLAAGLPASRQMPIKTWRAMHAATLSGLNLESAQELASATLGHSSIKVTIGSYHSARNALLPLMPPLFTL